METGEIFYNITNDHLKGSFDTSLSVRVGEGAKYKFINMYYLEIEGSYHKILKGYNSHNGYYNTFIAICKHGFVLKKHRSIDRCFLHFIRIPNIRQQYPMPHRCR